MFLLMISDATSANVLSHFFYKFTLLVLQKKLELFTEQCLFLCVQTPIATTSSIHNWAEFQANWSHRFLFAFFAVNSRAKTLFILVSLFPRIYQSLMHLHLLPVSTNLLRLAMAIRTRLVFTTFNLKVSWFFNYKYLNNFSFLQSPPYPQLKTLLKAVQPQMVFLSRPRHLTLLSVFLAICVGFRCATLNAVENAVSPPTAVGSIRSAIGPLTNLFAITQVSFSFFSLPTFILSLIFH